METAPWSLLQRERQLDVEPPYASRYTAECRHDHSSPCCSRPPALRRGDWRHRLAAVDHDNLRTCHPAHEDSALTHSSRQSIADATCDRGLTHAALPLRSIRRSSCWICAASRVSCCCTPATSQTARAAATSTDGLPHVRFRRRVSVASSNPPPQHEPLRASLEQTLPKLALPHDRSKVTRTR